MNQHIIIIAEQIDGKITQVTYELIASAKVLQHYTDSDIKIIMTGCELSDAARRLSEQSGIDILVINPCIRTIPEEIIPDEIIPDEIVFKNLPASLFNNLKPTYVLMAHNTRGLDAAPGLAVKLNAACITGVEKITAQDEGIYFTRSIFNDRILAHIRPCAATSVLTILPGIFKPETVFNGHAGNVTSIAIDLALSSDDYHFIGFKNNAADTSALDNADVIVSAGNGIREKENLDLIYQLAELFSKSAVTGSRPICDKKWLRYSQQVGVTGATVKPKLYIACGISGSSQHISGMRDSRFIVSINTDPHAAILNIADVCIIEDLSTFIPQFITLYHGSQSI